MSGPGRTPQQTPGTRRPSVRTTRGSPASNSMWPAIRQAQSVLSAQQQAIASLQAQLAGQHPSPTPKVPSSAAPEKCTLDMTMAVFRSWTRSMTCWLNLCRLQPPEAAHHIRLFCVPALQRALDARFTDAQWGALSIDAALKEIGKVVLRSTNQAVQWSDFF